jgi:hypothetical protein
MTELQHEKISNSGDTALNRGSIKDINAKVDKQKVTDLFNSLCSTKINQQQK